ncbi:hypothetical protein ASPSYDRAFT_38289 [Aspergillus sydowii CBS 593.65]|uniref:Secreted protein n=1 Tax=Aspergillus sydowii CBS 593.65 TaxID=1036612 RepID=A0A1L9TW80_9EURO|nr:uncharacterized protein ASPSYDRAFT_38289 [Aspergillus sydowii CBS 593.65]OJJ63676.1 hypothetical protein ASPSYDRAFT_38289 [Aspergillus sydowii CBS 593.65]
MKLLSLCSLTALADAHRTFWLLLGDSPPPPPARPGRIEGLSLIDITTRPVTTHRELIPRLPRARVTTMTVFALCTLMFSHSLTE